MIFLISLFFFSSRRRHTRWPRDWSSDVCSSDLGVVESSIRVRRAYRSLEFGAEGTLPRHPKPNARLRLSKRLRAGARTAFRGCRHTVWLVVALRPDSCRQALSQYEPEASCWLP